MSRPTLPSSILLSRVKDAMQANGHSIHDLSERCQVSWQTVDNWMKGRNEPQPRHRQSLYRYSYYTVGAQSKPERNALAKFLSLFSVAK